MRRNILILREKRHVNAYWRAVRRATEEAPALDGKAGHHNRMGHIAWRARHEFKRRPRETT